jgi:hypothetical protein
MSCKIKSMHASVSQSGHEMSQPLNSQQYHQSPAYQQQIGRFIALTSVPIPGKITSKIRVLVPSSNLLCPFVTDHSMGDG